MKKEIFVRHFSFFLAAIAVVVWTNSCQTDSRAANVANAPKDSLAVAKAALGTTDTAQTVAVAVTPTKLPKAKLDSNSRVVYLTFDDGPLMGSDYVNKIVAEKQIKMSVFVVGKHALASKNFGDMLAAYKANPYIEVCNHSYSHANNQYQYFYSNPERSAQDVMSSEEKLGLTMKIVRLPGRDIWLTPSFSRGMKQNGNRTATLLLENGYQLYGWDCEWEHRGNLAAKQTPEQMVAIVDNLMRSGSSNRRNHVVLLGHDQMLYRPENRGYLSRIIDLLKERGYVFEFISNYPQQNS